MRPRNFFFFFFWGGGWGGVGRLICNYNCNHDDISNQVYILYHKSAIKQPRGLFISKTLRGTLVEMWGLFNLVQPMVSVLHKELLVGCRVEKLKYKKFEVMQQGSKANPNFQLVNKPSRISPLKVLQS